MTPPCQSLPIAVCERGLMLQRKSRSGDEGQSRPARTILIGIVRREEDALGADTLERSLQVRLTPHPTRRDVEVLTDVVSHRSLKMCDSGHGIQPLQIKQHDLA